MSEKVFKLFIDSGTTEIIEIIGNSFPHPNSNFGYLRNVIRADGSSSRIADEDIYDLPENLHNHTPKCPVCSDIYSETTDDCGEKFNVWQLDRRREVNLLSEMLYKINSLRSGGDFIGKSLEIINAAEILTKSSDLTGRLEGDSFLGFIGRICARKIEGGAVMTNSKTCNACWREHATVKTCHILDCKHGKKLVNISEIVSERKEPAKYTYTSK